MPWIQTNQFQQIDPLDNGWYGFTLPNTGGFSAWCLRYFPDNLIPENLARIGFYVPSVLVDSQILAGPSRSFVSRPKGGPPFAQHFDYAYLNNYVGLANRAQEYYVSFQPVAWAPSGTMRLLGLQ